MATYDTNHIKEKIIIIQYKFTVLNNDWYLHTVRVTLVNTNYLSSKITNQ